MNEFTCEHMVGWFGWLVGWLVGQDEGDERSGGAGDPELVVEATIWGFLQLT